jgi:alkylation response protein AidB-like acyl-CoA dehydrogenase
MDFELGEEAIMIRDMMRRFVQKDAQPLEMPLFNQGELTAEQERTLKTKIMDQMGLWGVTVPEDFGGEELDMLSACLIEEELGQTFVPVDYGDVTPVLFACNENQVETYLEPAVEGDRRPVLALREPDELAPQEWKTRAVRNGAGYLLNGLKSLGRTPRDDDFFVVFAQSEEGVTAFLVEPDHPGVRLNGHSQVVFTDCHLPDEAVLGVPGRGLRLGNDYLAHQQVKMGARYVGMAQRLLDMSAQYARDWVSMGQPLALRPAVMRMIAEMAADIQAARYLVYHAAWKLDEGEVAKDEAAVIRLFTGQMIRSAIDKTIMVHGGTNYLEKEPALRMYRNLVPDQALELALEHSRMAVANRYLELQAMMEEREQEASA